MSVIDFNEARVIKTLKQERLIKSKEQVKFHDIPEELREAGVDSLMTTDGKEFTKEDLESVKEFLKKYKNGEIKI
jgi:hypothetical protein